MKLIYGTKNISKIHHMDSILHGLPVDLKGIDPSIVDVEETGNDILENAKQKALHYYKLIKEPVFSCDSGLYIDHLEEHEQPGIHVRRVNGKRLNDDEMIDHYSQIAKDHDGDTLARYRNAICLVLDENHIITYDGDAIASEPFIIAKEAHITRKEGFPLDALSIDPNSRSYYYDIDVSRSNGSVMNFGFRSFFMDVIKRPLVTLEFDGYDAIELELYPEFAPETVANFIDLINNNYYLDKSLCRSVPKRLIQSGDRKLKPENWTDDTPGYILNGEFNRKGFINPLSFTSGTLGMAMAADCITDYATAGSFFIMTKDESKLDDIVPAFGRVVKGMDIVHRLNDLETHNDYGFDAPRKPVEIKSMTVNTFGWTYPVATKVSFTALDK